MPIETESVSTNDLDVGDWIDWYHEFEPHKSTYRPVEIVQFEDQLDVPERWRGARVRELATGKVHEGAWLSSPTDRWLGRPAAVTIYLTVEAWGQLPAMIKNAATGPASDGGVVPVRLDRRRARRTRLHHL